MSSGILEQLNYIEEQQKKFERGEIDIPYWQQVARQLIKNEPFKIPEITNMSDEDMKNIRVPLVIAIHTEACWIMSEKYTYQEAIDTINSWIEQGVPPEVGKVTLLQPTFEEVDGWLERNDNKRTVTLQELLNILQGLKNE